MDICIFEDRAWEDLTPLVYARPVFSLVCGTRTLLEKVRTLYPGAAIRLSCRDYLKDLVAEQTGLPVNAPGDPGGTLFLNGRLLLESPVLIEGREEVAARDGFLLFARLKGPAASRLTPHVLLNERPEQMLLAGVSEGKIDARTVRYFWDLVNANGSEMLRELARGPRGIEGQIYEGAHLVNRSEIFVAPGAKIKPGVVIDAEGGPVHIGEDTVVSANTSIEGPVYIGRKALVQATARIRPNSTIGDVCKIGGEIEDAIVHGFSNKQHDGFLGHAYVGQWVNLAADTINSDLKNTYGPVRVSFGRRRVDSGQMFVGLAVGDHSKSAINSCFLTGSVVGFSSNVVVSSFPPKFVPSFSWCADGGLEPYELEKALEVARRVMARRKKTMGAAEESVFRKVYELSRPEREAALEALEE